MASLSRAHLANGRKQIAVFAFDDVGMNISEDGVFELHELDTFFSWMQSKGIDFSKATALDIGANIGNHGLYFSDHFKTVHCFEPSNRTFRVLKINSELSTRIVCHNFGLSSSERLANLRFDQTNVGGASASMIHLLFDGEQIALKRLDDIRFGSEDIRLLKIDVEGHEYDALLGAKQTIKQHRPIVLFEQLPQEIWKMTSNTIDLLRSYGYVRFAVLERFPVAPSWTPGPLKDFAALLMKLIRPTSTKVCITSGFEAKYYSLIVALPAWLKT